MGQWFKKDVIFEFIITIKRTSRFCYVNIVFFFAGGPGFMPHRGPGPRFGPGFGPGFGPPGFGGPGPGFGFDHPRPGFGPSFGFDGPRPGFDGPGPRFGFDGPRPRFDGPGPRFDPAPNVSSPNIPQVNQGNTDSYSHHNYIEK